MPRGRRRILSCGSIYVLQSLQGTFTTRHSFQNADPSPEILSPVALSKLLRMVSGVSPLQSTTVATAGCRVPPELLIPVALVIIIIIKLPIKAIASTPSAPHPTGMEYLPVAL
jgi:hypothetical protein